MANDAIITLEDARTLVQRGVDKTEDLFQRTSFVVVDRFGVIVSASRMDGARTMSYRISRAKAYLTAIQQANTGEMYDFAMMVPKILIEQMRGFVREPVFHGQGAQLVYKDDMVIGALSTGVGIAPFVKFPNVPAEKMIADGKPANGEDLVISYALGGAYSPQHGDDEAKWLQAYGEPPAGKGTAMDEVPRAHRQVELDMAIRMSDAAIAEAHRRQVVVSIAIVDQGGEVLQLDRMDGAFPMTPDAAIALAGTALNFGGASENAASYPDLQGLIGATDRKFIAAPGGLSLVRDGRAYGGIGVSGADPGLCAEIARVALGAP